MMAANQKIHKSNIIYFSSIFHMYFIYILFKYICECTCVKIIKCVICKIYDMDYITYAHM